MCTFKERYDKVVNATKQTVKVELSKSVLKDIQKNVIPDFIRTKLFHWTDVVEEHGIEKTRKSPGYHDEPLKGDRIGQRSIRLNRSWRAIYKELKTKEILILCVLEVNKHDY